MTCKPFDCYKCGACCHFLHLHPNYKDWKHPDKPHCKYLNDDKTCAIYKTRPEICRVDMVYNLNYSHIEWDKYCEASLEVCKFLEKMVYGKN